MQIPLPQQTRYDQAARYLLLKAGPLLFVWLLARSPARLRFERWLPTALALPGVPERLCDAVAHLTDLEHGGRPVAGLLEVQTVPDATMTGRLLLAGGLFWLTVKPAPLPGDRYDLVGVVVNLTGVGDAARSCVVAAAEWTLKPVEVNFETLDAAAVLDEVAAGRAPRELLAFVPLMKHGDRDDIIQRWRAVAEEADPTLRADLTLTRLFAERVDRLPAWLSALEGFKMVESPIIAKLLADEQAEAVLRVLLARFKKVPDDLAATIRACQDTDRLRHWLDEAAVARSLAKFRQKAGL